MNKKMIYIIAVLVLGQMACYMTGTEVFAKKSTKYFAMNDGGYALCFKAVQGYVKVEFDKEGNKLNSYQMSDRQAEMICQTYVGLTMRQITPNQIPEKVIVKIGSEITSLMIPGE